MEFLFAKTAVVAAAISAVRLPQSGTATSASLVVKAPRPSAPVTADKRGRQRAERARYHAQCRMAMAF